MLKYLDDVDKGRRFAKRVCLMTILSSWSTEAEAPVLWPPDVKNWLVEKDPEARKDWRQKENEMTEDEMVGWHHRLYGYEFEQALEVGDR